MLYERAEHIFKHRVLGFWVCIHSVQLLCEYNQYSSVFVQTAWSTNLVT